MKPIIARPTRGGEAEIRECRYGEHVIPLRLERYAQPHPKVIDGDTLQLLMQPVSAVAGEGLTSSQIRNYNVVVGQFRQIFNARQMRQRLIASGYASTLQCWLRRSLCTMS